MQRRTAGALITTVLLVFAAACADDDDTGGAPTTGDATSSSVDASSSTAPDDSDGGEPGAEACDAPYAMDASALGVEPAAPRQAVEEFVRTILGWTDATVVASARPCGFVATSPSHERPVSLVVAASGPTAAVVSSASSFDDEPDGSGVGVLLRGSEASITTGASCPTCERATVHVVYAGGVESVDVGLPVEAQVDLPADATQRGFVILLRSPSGAVEAVLALSVPDGDFTAG